MVENNLKYLHAAHNQNATNHEFIGIYEIYESEIRRLLQENNKLQHAATQRDKEYQTMQEKHTLMHQQVLQYNAFIPSIIATKKANIIKEETIEQLEQLKVDSAHLIAKLKVSIQKHESLLAIKEREIKELQTDNEKMRLLLKNTTLVPEPCNS